ncbi:hypothetical protein NHX12_020983 [Muraenolepis orangiensis]|uniref:Uncharacterized protein n=1 Tax=Muraenolepis orangiensis TaxID=630683 RepID=A0A9Q0EUM2_9TELE|nr:hypothetical protein NHX12_020983 [Muraenolepis orangiensis]
MEEDLLPDPLAGSDSTAWPGSQTEEPSSALCPGNHGNHTTMWRFRSGLRESRTPPSMERVPFTDPRKRK